MYEVKIMNDNKEVSQHEIIELLKQKLKGNSNILFVGSGFSKGAIGFSGELPIAKDLAKTLGKLGSFDAEDDLKYAADLFLGNNDYTKKNELKNELNKIFTVTKLQKYHTEIVNYPWKTIYTTNYDNCIEEAAKKADKNIIPFTMDNMSSLEIEMNTICLHINGSVPIQNIDELDKDFKLSHSSYIKSNDFSENDWSFRFGNDLDFASAIIFVGYSLYDVDIEKILQQNAVYKDKIFFIIGKDNKENKMQHYMQKIGYILKINTDEFASIITDIKPSAQCKNIAEKIGLLPYHYEVENTQISDKDVRDFLLYGRYSKNLDYAVLSEKNIGSPMLVKRQELIQHSKKYLVEDNILVITSEMGNGKSIFLHMLMVILSHEGEEVFDITDFCRFDIALLNSETKPIYLFIDDYSNQEQFIKHFTSIITNKNIKLIISSRLNYYENNYLLLPKTHNVIDVNNLSSLDINFFITILNQGGFWGRKKDITNFHQKQKYLNNQCKSQISAILFDILKSDTIVNAYKKLFLDIIQHDEITKKTIFTLLLLSVLSIRKVAPNRLATLYKLTKNNKIFKLEYNRRIFLQNISGKEIFFRSSVSSILLIHANFDVNFIKNQLLNIVEIAYNIQNKTMDKNNEYKKLYKSLLIFSIIEPLFPSDGKRKIISEYYEGLKIKISNISELPHYWLQYAMSKIQDKDLDTAESYFEEAYRLADYKQYKNLDAFDTQYARYLFIRSRTMTDIDEHFNLFTEGVEKIKNVRNDIPKFNQLDILRDIYKNEFRIYTESQKATFLEVCNNFKQDLQKCINDKKNNNNQIFRLLQIKKALDHIQ